MRSPADQRVVILGAGVGGLAAAVAVRASGRAAVVCDRVPDPAAEGGTSFNLWGNGVTALDRLGLGGAVREAGAPLEVMRLLTHRGLLVAENPIGVLSRRLGTASVNIRRSDLAALLLDAARRAGAEIHLGCAGVGHRATDDGVALELDDGSTIEGDVLVGADGARSVVRRELSADGGPVDSSLPVRGISELDPGVPPDTVLMVWGSRGGGAGCWPLRDGRVSWTVGTTATLRTALRGPQAGPALEEFVAVLPGPVEALVRATPLEHRIVTPVLVHPTVSWGAGRVALLGDAAHAMPTVYSQGACQALEDAVVLGEALAGGSDVLEALRGYRERRGPRLDWLRRKVFALDRMQKFESRTACAIRDVMARRARPDRSSDTWDTILRFGEVA